MRLSALIAFPFLALLAACGGNPAQTTPPSATGPVMGLPGGVVRTDGERDLQLTESGAARCNLINSAEIGRALIATNNARARQGLKPMQLNGKAQAAAEGQACDMATRGTMTHTGSSTKGPAARIKAQGYKPSVTAENIAAGRFTPDQATAEFTASPKHLANIIIPGVRDFGTAYAIGPDGRTAFHAAVYAQPR